MKPDIQTPEDLKLLVDSFYENVLKDDIIGYIFTDVAKIDMEHHLPKMYAFWESIVFGTAGYKGNPMTSHISLNQKEKLTDEHFERWIGLFESNLNNLFDGPNATEALNRAKGIAALMKYKVQE